LKHFESESEKETFMLNALYTQLDRYTTVPVVALLFVLFLMCQMAFEARRKALPVQSHTPDATFWYSPATARDQFEAMGPDGRRLYAITEVTLDLIFPIIYGGLYTLLILQLYQREQAKYLMLIPLLTSLTDLMENFSIAYLAWNFDGKESGFTRVAATFTAVKSVLFLLSLLTIFAGAVRGLRHAAPSSSA
jgi:hypothetical protein